MTQPPTPRGAGRRSGLSATALVALTLLVALLATPSSALAQQRNFDAREAAVRAVELIPSPSQEAALDDLRARIPNLEVRIDPTTGAASTVSNRTGYLTEGDAEATPLAIGMGFVEAHLDLFGLAEADLNEYEVTDSVFSKVTGASHLYLRQELGGIPVYNGQLQFHVNRDGRLMSVNNAFVPYLAEVVNTTSPKYSAGEAVAAAAKHLGLPNSGGPGRVRTAGGATQVTELSADGLSERPIVAQLMLLPIHGAEVRLVWNFQIWTLDDQHAYDFTVDAQDGRVWTRFDWVADDSYRVYPLPAESPNHVTPVPPADGRSLLVGPADPTASPFGWHDTNGVAGAEFTIHRGNNAHAYDDIDNNNAPPASEPDCGASLNCDFAINLTLAPNQYIPAAVANLFYWNNIVHDVQYQYGFDEAGGNFQQNNYGLGGSGADYVQAEAQDGSGSNNANFATPPDGSRPRMQMYIWTAPTPDKDGDLDSGIIIHEYGHGISNRQVGGPSNTSCLSNTQQPGEGWSDWLSLAYTAEVGDAGTDGRGIGTYALDQPTTGPGIRTQRYSTDPSINTWTYSTISTGVSVPHGVGAVWAQGVWEAYWALVDLHGFSSDIYNAAGGAGNQRMMLYVNEGLKNTACSPTFLDARDGIIQAAVDNYGGVDVCPLWEAFAAYGLGTDASTGGSNSTSATNGFSVPPECQCTPFPVADAGPDQLICLGDSVQVGTPAQPNNTYSWSPGGQTTAQITVAPTTTTVYTVTATTAACGSDSDSVTVTVDNGSAAGLDDDFEGGAGAWTSSGLWHLTSNSSCASPGYSSPVNAFYFGQDSTCDYSTGGTVTGDLVSPTIIGITSASTLSFDYYRVVESFSGSYDQTEVAVSGNGGATWTTVWSMDSSNASTAAWTSSGSISLASFAGQSIQLRFRFNSVDSVSNTFTGWFVDDVVVTGESPCGPGGNTAPVVSITSPANGSTFTQGASVSFAGTATDAEDGNISGSLSWASSLDGPIGSGASFSTSGLSVGSHTITASVTDSGGLPGSDSITVTIDPVTGPTTITILSTGSQDGWIRESNETSNAGGSNNSTNSGNRALRVGDSTGDRQYKTIVSFDTSSIPDGATILSATLRLKRGRVTGTNPFNILGSCFVDVQTGGFGGNVALANGDFQAAATVSQSATMSNPTSNGTFSEGSLNGAGLSAIDKTGVTQMRIYFSTDDNDDGGNDYMGYYSGDSGTADRPQLVVTYQ
ncbi:MAG: M36 family metallopeptidase [Acidobacteria bacterium]|nr:M36 family metallopeptidase [Acidobacteriota bacterium]